LSEAGQESVVEHGDHWLLPIADREVTQCRVDSDFSLVFCEPERNDVVVRFGAFHLKPSPGTEQRLDPNRAVDELGRLWLSSDRRSREPLLGSTVGCRSTSDQERRSK